MDKKLRENINEYIKYSLLQYLEINPNHEKNYERILSRYLENIASWNDLNVIINMKNDIDTTLKFIQEHMNKLTKENMNNLMIIAGIFQEKKLNQFNIDKIFIELTKFFSTSKILLDYLDKEKTSITYKILFNFFVAVSKSNDSKMIVAFENNELEKILNILEVMVNRGRNEDLKSMQFNLFLYMIKNKTVESLLDLSNEDLESYLSDLDYSDFIKNEKIESDKKKKKRSFFKRLF